MPASTDHPLSSAVTLTTGLPDTVLPEDPPEVVRGLAAASSAPPERRRDLVCEVVRRAPASPAAWAALGELARDDVEAYACYRVGYHRGLDGLRAAGWRGSGTVRWAHPSNRGFLTCLDGLRAAAGALGEHAEEERCALFLRQLDPGWRREWTGIPA